MAITRCHPSVQIFRDSVPSQDDQIRAYSPRSLDSSVSITDISSHSHTLLAPPRDHSGEPSPQKTHRVSSSPPPSAFSERRLNTVSLPPPEESLFATDAPIKKVRLSSPEQSHTMAEGQQDRAGFSFQMNKENMMDHSESIASAILTAELPEKPVNKRLASDAAPLRDRSKKMKTKEVKIEEADVPLPNPDQMPQVEDNGSKPSFSYAMLIGMAILRAPNRRLTLAQIYKWISDTFAFYQNSQETGWQNSIRHNLSLSKSFSKQERPKDDPGKGHYWIINAGYEKQYYKVKPVRQLCQPENPMSGCSGQAHRPGTAMSSSFPPTSSTQKPDLSKRLSEPEVPSSDATILCSDPAAHDGQDPPSMLPPRQIPSSPPPIDIHSSPPPPVSRSHGARSDTPPRGPSFLLRSRSGGRKRKFNGLGDSGYYSSIESSAIKGNPPGSLLTSDTDIDRPPIKCGRAEAEIARIRGSSCDSPSKARPHGRELNNGQLALSPFRHANKADAPLTPAVVFKRPAIPPTSASPNTNLRNHRNKIRELVGGSPDKSLAMWVDTSFLDNKTWSPAIPTPNEENANLVGQGFDGTFDMFGDLNYSDSPIKRTTKRPRIERAVTTTGILADVTGAKKNTMNSPTPNLKMTSSFLKVPDLSPTRKISPLKNSILKGPTSNPSRNFSFPNSDKENVRSDWKPPQSFDRPSIDSQQQDDDEIFRLLHSDESEPGIDLLQGFEKIGARASFVAPNGSPQKAFSRPNLSRSSTVHF